MKKLFVFWIVLSFSLAQVPSSAFAIGSGSFENATFTAAALGRGNAVVASSNEAGVVTYNPAGLVDVPGIQMQSSLAGINIVTRHSAGGDSTYGRSGVVPVPTTYLSINPGKAIPGEILDDRLAFGIGVDAPFGLLTQYSSTNRIAHFAGWANWLKMYSVKPMMAIRVTDFFSIGGGPTYNRIMDYGQVFSYPNLLAVPGAPDGEIRANLRGHGWGYQFSALLKAHEKHRLAFYFRGPTTAHISGLVKVAGATVGGNFEVSGKAKLDLPLNMTLGYAFKPSDRTTLELDLAFTRWRSHKRVFVDAVDLINVADDAILAAVGKIEHDYGNAWTINWGGEHRLKSFNDKLTLRTGGIFFFTPIHEANFTSQVPDSNALALTAGFGYDLAKHIRFDLAYFIRYWFHREVDNVGTEGLGLSLDGNYKSFGQEVQATLTFLWDDFFGPVSEKIAAKQVPLEEDFNLDDFISV